MFRMLPFPLSIALIGLILAPPLTFAQERPDRLAPIAHLLDAQTIAVARLDLAKVDVVELLKFAATLSPMEMSAEELHVTTMKARSFLVLLREYGAKDVYVVLSLADFPENPPVIAFSLKSGANADLIKEHIKTTFPPQMELGQLKETLVLAMPPTMKRLKENRTVARPDLAAALQGADDSAVQVAAAIPPDVQRVIRELLGKLPPEIGGGQGSDLVDALQWSNLALELPPTPSIKWTIQSKNEAAAVGLRPRILAGLNLAGQQSKLNETLPEFAELAVKLTPAVKGDRLELTLAGDELAGVIKQLKAGPLRLMSAAGAQAQSSNNLKQIALAMHNYHDVNRAFPAAASRGKDGKPLLSWRVHVLPFIEGEALYRQFKLDEPWDSEHNKKLIPLMPKTYLSPAHPELVKDGKTVYAVPVGERTPFGGKTGTFLGKIVDGTSNTLMLVELSPENAVVWSKPEDWQFQTKDPGAGLIDGKRKRFLTAFCDGSVRAIPMEIDLDDLRRLVIMDDGEVISKQY
jgi:hypothetical protein